MTQRKYLLMKSLGIQQNWKTILVKSYIDPNQAWDECERLMTIEDDIEVSYYITCYDVSCNIP